MQHRASCKHMSLFISVPEEGDEDGGNSYSIHIYNYYYNYHHHHHHPHHHTW